MEWKYGKYKWNWIREKPTQKKFKGWKQKFLSLPEVKNYEVWVCGGFLEKWETWDIDIILFGPKNLEKIEKLLYEGTNIGIKDYNMFVDISYNTKDSNFFCNKTKKLIKQNKINIGNKIIQDGKFLSYAKHAKQLTSGLWFRTETYPKEKQLKKVYKQKPKCIKYA